MLAITSSNVSQEMLTITTSVRVLVIREGIAISMTAANFDLIEADTDGSSNQVFDTGHIFSMRVMYPLGPVTVTPLTFFVQWNLDCG